MGGCSRETETRHLSLRGRISEPSGTPDVPTAMSPSRSPSPPTHLCCQSDRRGLHRRNLRGIWPAAGGHCPRSGRRLRARGGDAAAADAECDGAAGVLRRTGSHVHVCPRAGAASWDVPKQQGTGVRHRPLLSGWLILYRGGGGSEAKKKFVYLKSTSKFGPL